MPAAAIVARLAAARPRLLAAGPRAAGATPSAATTPWGWVYMILHGHYLDHLAVIEPWADAAARRARSTATRSSPTRGRRTTPDFRAQDAAIAAQFDALVRPVPVDALDRRRELTPGWTLRDHVGHLADWAAEAVRAIEVYRATRPLAGRPRRGHRRLERAPCRGVARGGETPARRWPATTPARAGLLAAAGTLSVEELRSPDGWAWAYDCLHGHVRKHLAMLGPWCAAIDWPAAR